MHQVLHTHVGLLPVLCICHLPCSVQHGQLLHAFTVNSAAQAQKTYTWLDIEGAEDLTIGGK